MNFEYQDESVLLLFKEDNEERNNLNEIPYFSTLFNYYTTVGGKIEKVEIHFADLLLDESSIEAFDLHLKLVIVKNRQLVNDEVWNEEKLQEAKKQLTLIDNFFYMEDSNPYYRKEILSWMKKRNFINIVPSDIFYHNYLSKYPYIDSLLTNRCIDYFSSERGPSIPRIPIYHQPEIIHSPYKDILEDEINIRKSLKRFSELMNIKNIAIHDGSIVFYKIMRQKKVNIFIYSITKDTFAKKIEEIVKYLILFKKTIKIYKYFDRFEIVDLDITYIIHRTLYKSTDEILSFLEPDIDSHLIIKEEKEIRLLFTSRFRLAFSTQMNITNPFHCSEDYNQRVYDAFNRGIHIFVPNSLHLRYNYLYPYLKETKSLKGTFHELLLMIHERRKNKKEEKILLYDNFLISAYGLSEK